MTTANVQPIMRCPVCGRMLLRTQVCTCGTRATDGETRR